MLSDVLFPAQAGVILCAVFASEFTYPVPRASGGDPSLDALVFHRLYCSPRKRG